MSLALSASMTSDARLRVHAPPSSASTYTTCAGRQGNDQARVRSCRVHIRIVHRSQCPGPRLEVIQDQDVAAAARADDLGEHLQAARLGVLQRDVAQHLDLPVGALLLPELPHHVDVCGKGESRVQR